MEQRNIHVFINEKPYTFRIQIIRDGDLTVYKIDPDHQPSLPEDPVPPGMEFQVNGTMHLDNRVQTVEGAEIARLIWEGITDQLNHS